ncbi:LysM peptidoglycan-binding domain-containing protein [Isoalcanivorax beigongshangi]|uniref:LysM peptidoglycan-binding domain-containing protein n=1 Tax=Isoalcanivorax beigongshangi TaxID=3238810 RepID=A0ABV4ACN5_9GAMM
MMKSLLRALSCGVLLGFAGWVGADVALRSDPPQEYHVKKGDTLWDISNAFLRNPWQWPALWHQNPHIDNPHLIYPGDVLHLVYINGQPQLDISRVVALSPGDERLSPQVRELPLSSAIPAIPLSSIQSFLREALILSKEDVDNAPYLVGGTDRRVIYGSNDTVYGRDPVNKWQDLAPDYGVYRVGQPYIDATTREVLGYGAVRIGTMRVTAQDGELVTFRVTAANEDLRANDRILLSPEHRQQSIYYPSAPDNMQDGNVLQVFGRLNSAARHDVVVLNRGTRDGVQEGNVLEVFQRGEQVRDRNRGEMLQLPDVKAGTLVVFRAFEKASYALIIESTRAIYVQDLVRSPTVD